MLRALKRINKQTYLPIDLIEPNPAQPRKVFDEAALQELADSISHFGILQPLSVRKLDDSYELIAGERRLRAARIAGLSKVPCIIFNIKTQDSALLAMIENLQREDLDYFEEAQGIKTLINVYSLTQEEVALRLGKSQSAIANKLRLLRFSEAAKILMRQYDFTERHCRCLLKLTDQKLLFLAIDIITKRKLNVSQTENLVEQLLSEKTKKKKRPIFAFKDVRLFVNTINKAIDTMKNSGVQAKTEKIESSAHIIYTITIPKQIS